MIDLSKKYNLELKAGKDFMIKENHWLPEKMGADFFVFGKIMYCRRSMGTLPDHEFLHIAQFSKYGTILVILHYLLYLSLNLIRFWNFKKAFIAIPFEIEARSYEESSEKI
jgi:hypothetical protein